MAKAASFVSSLKEKYGHLDLSIPKTKVFNTDVILFQRWAYKVGKGWYGFALCTAPNSWATIINEFLEWLEKQDPDFEIHQIKLKMGGLRFYVGLSETKGDKFHSIQSEITELENWLHHNSLVY